MEMARKSTILVNIVLGLAISIGIATPRCAYAQSSLEDVIGPSVDRYQACLREAQVVPEEPTIARLEFPSDGGRVVIVHTNQIDRSIVGRCLSSTIGQVSSPPHRYARFTAECTFYNTEAEGDFQCRAIERIEPSENASRNSPIRDQRHEGICAEIECSGHGHCVVVDNRPRCACHAGYLPDSTGINCRPEASSQATLPRATVGENTTEDNVRQAPIELDRHPSEDAGRRLRGAGIALGIIGGLVGESVGLYLFFEESETAGIAVIVTSSIVTLVGFILYGIGRRILRRTREERSSFRYNRSVGQADLSFW